MDCGAVVDGVRLRCAVRRGPRRGRLRAIPVRRRRSRWWASGWTRCRRLRSLRRRLRLHRLFLPCYLLHPHTPSASPSLPTAQPSSSSSSPPSSSSSSSSSSSLPTGAIAGIAVGSITFLAAISIALWFLFMRKRRTAAQQHGTPYEIDGERTCGASQGPEKYAYSAELESPPAELPAGSECELESRGVCAPQGKA